MAQSPKVSVVIPTYMEEKNIGNTLASLKTQKVPFDFEVVISDASSQDKTVEIAKYYGAHVILEPKSTIADGRARGAKAAKGEIIISTSADTIFEQGWLENMVAPFSDPKVAAVQGMVLPENGTWIENLFADFVLHKIAKLLSYAHLYYANGDSIAVRSDVYKKCGGINPKLVTAEDTDLLMKASRFGKVYYSGSARVRTLMRRIRKWGYPKFLWFHTSNYFMTNLFNKPADHYETIRD